MSLADSETSPVLTLSTTGESRQTSHQSRTWLLGGLVIVFLRALPNLRYPLCVDTATFSEIGQGLLRGQLLYRDLWDIKPPGIFYIYAVIVKVFGPVMWSGGVLDILWLLVISCCIFYFARPYLGAPAAALAMIFNASRHCGEEGYIHAGQAEVFMMLGVFAAWFLLRPGGRWRLPRCLAAGLVMGAMFWLKYNAIMFFPFLLLVPFLDFHPWDQGSSQVRMVIPWKDWLARMLPVAAGFILVICAVLVHFWAAGAWPALKEAQFVVLPRYGAGVFRWNFMFPIWALDQYQHFLGFWTLAVAAISLVIAWRRRELWLLVPILLLAFSGFICTVVQGRLFSYHFETCYPSFSMLWGYLCVRTWQGCLYLRQVFAQHGWKLARTMLWLVFAGLVLSLFPEEAVRVRQQYEFLAYWWRKPELSYQFYYWQHPHEKLADQIRVIQFIEKNSRPNDEVYVFGFSPLINYLTQRRSPTRFISNPPVISVWGLAKWREELVRTLQTKRPRYIVVERNDAMPIISGTTKDSEQCLLAFLPLANLVRRDYQPAVNYLDFEVYELKKRE